MADNGITVLRLALAVTYLWFGGLKLAGKSPVEDIVQETAAPILPRSLAVPATGILEVVIGLGLLTRTALRFTLLLFFAQMASTFLVLLRLRHRSFQGGNPLLLTKTGEFVVKNLVLLSAGLVIGSTMHRDSERLPKR
jgi:uncharacterized membrane protein YphA (DoxX/SURF4 family)